MSEFVNKEYVEIDFQDILIKEEELKNCTFIKCRFRGIDASEISTENCNFIECDFTGALLTLLSIKELHLQIVLVGANLFVSKFEECKMTGSDFEEANLDGITIISGDWSYTNLRFANLSKQMLKGIRLVEADLYECNLEKQIYVKRI